MAVLKQMPSEGQFVAIYEANGKMWGNTYRNEKGRVLQYYEHKNEFRDCSFPYATQHVIAYITLEEGYLK